jgi:ABC-type transport system involved in multi-copper enzyme maturation permease subunit
VVVLSVLSERLFPSTKNPINGFNPLINGSINGFRFSSYLILIIGSLLFASETTLGTLKTIFIAPFRRSEFVIAKIITLFILSVLFTFIIELLSIGLAFSVYGFSDIKDPTFVELIHLSSSEILLYTAYSFIHIIVPLITVGLMGLFISVLVDNAGIAVGVSIIIYLILDTFIAGLYENLSSFLFTPYLTYYLEPIKNITDGILEEIWKFELINRAFGFSKQDISLDIARNISVIKSFIVPIGYSAIFTFLSIILVSKRPS